MPDRDDDAADRAEDTQDDARQAREDTPSPQEGREAVPHEGTHLAGGLPGACRRAADPSRRRARARRGQPVRHPRPAGLAALAVLRRLLRRPRRAAGASSSAWSSAGWSPCWSSCWSRSSWPSGSTRSSRSSCTAASAGSGRCSWSAWACSASLTLFVVALVPVLRDQITALIDNGPGYLDQLQHNNTVEGLDRKYDVIDKAKEKLQDPTARRAGLRQRLHRRPGRAQRLVQRVLDLRADAVLPVGTAEHQAVGATRWPRPRVATASPRSATRSCVGSVATSPVRSWSRCAPASRRSSSSRSSASGSTPSRWRSWWRSSTSSR